MVERLDRYGGSTSKTARYGVSTSKKTGRNEG